MVHLLAHFQVLCQPQKSEYVGELDCCRSLPLPGSLLTGRASCCIVSWRCCDWLLLCGGGGAASCSSFECGVGSTVHKSKDKPSFILVVGVHCDFAQPGCGCVECLWGSESLMSHTFGPCPGCSNFGCSPIDATSFIASAGVAGSMHGSVPRCVGGKLCC